MGYVKTPFPAFSPSTNRIAQLESTSKGVCFGKDDLYLQTGQSPCMINLEAFSGALKTRAGQCSVFGTEPLCSAFHSITKQPFFNATIFHSGTNLYKLSSENQNPLLLFSDMPDAHSVFVEFKAKLYIYTSLRIYSVDKDFNVIEEMPYAPIMFENCSYSQVSSKVNTNNKLNLAAPAVTVSYRESNLGSKQYNLPIQADPLRPIVVKAENEIMDPSKYTLSNNKVLFDDYVFVDSSRSLTISFFAKNYNDIGFEDKFSNCTLGTTFGGTIISGTRVFMTGNKNLPGYYFKSQLLDPLHFDPDNYDIIGSGNENISAMIKQYGNLVIFTDNSVFRMTYDLTNSETYFSVKELSHYIGCDMPKSVEIIDNRIVFANSSKGVFIIDSSEDFGEQNIKPISGNINEGDDVCLLNRDIHLLKNAFSIDFNRKYYLCVGTYVYVWDYNAKSYSASSDYSSSQQKLVWYVFSNIKAKAFFELDSKLYTAETGKDSGFAVFQYSGKDFDEPIEYKFSCAKTYLSFPHLYKCINQLELALDCDSNIKMNLYDDDTIFFSLLLKKSDKTKYCFRIPARKTNLFSFSLSGKGNMHLSNIFAKYNVFS